MSDTKQLAFSAAQIDAILAAAQRCSNRNLLDNWDFRNPVNQRGASGTISAADYFIDRWKLVSGTVAITANGLTLNGTIRQIREAAIGATVKPSVEMYSGTATTSYNDTTKYCDIVSSGGTIARCKLELGTVSTLANDPPADYGEELRKCQRYCLKLTEYIRFINVGLNSGIIDFIIPTPVTMRGLPVIMGAPEVRDFNTWSVVSGFNFAVAVHSGNAIMIRATKAEHGLTMAQLNIPAGGILLSADL